MTETPEVEVPEGPTEDRDARDLVSSIWQYGWKAGHRHGWMGGYREGKAALNQRWAVLAIVVALLCGIAAGYGMDWVQTCVPIAVGEEKSCVTRIGE